MDCRVDPTIYHFKKAHCATQKNWRCAGLVRDPPDKPLAPHPNAIDATI
jgi:hypothetical protein